MPQKQRIHEILKKYWGYDEFRPLQEDIIESALKGHDTLGLMPTGGGKSITFQVPAMLLDGMALVVTPIVSLMKDQVDHLIERHIKATYLHAGLTVPEMRRAYEKCKLGNCKFLYVSPERLSSQNFLDHLRHMPVNLIVVDEAHCISQWGYDFRPSFLHIAQVRKLFPQVPVIALTATATPLVVTDIMQKLQFRTPAVFQKSFARSNLSYVVRHTTEKLSELVHILQSVPGTGIVYVRSRQRTKLIADHLAKHGLNADYYHAGLPTEDKEDKQNKWKSDECRIIVATNAFGMGIDKPDVRIVVHVDVPNSLEEYYQEAGRAGRDGKHSYAVMLVSDNDKRTLHRHITDTFPPRDFIKQTYERMANFLHVAVGEGFNQMYEFNFNLFCSTFKLPILPTHNALKILSRSGLIEFLEDVDAQSRITILAPKEELYNISSAGSEADRVLQTVLRLYPGLFADYVFVNEDVIAKHAGANAQTVYESLLELTRRHFIHYVPRKRSPYIIFNTSREETKYIQIPKTVYEVLKERMTARVEAVLKYAFGQAQCRENELLQYFGETPPCLCGHCDHCIEQKQRARTTTQDVQSGILYMAQLQPRRLEDFVHTLSFPKDIIIKMVTFLTDEGFLWRNPDGTYTNPKPLDN
ncbi:MAG: RecQ family ATP-dependent DNA helicase [Muribaculaceae bacterium]|nr:RecQ family ATP-dependent DNA helicase [Muribaculaceae bacterium]